MIKQYGWIFPASYNLFSGESDMFTPAGRISMERFGQAIPGIIGGVPPVISEQGNRFEESNRSFHICHVGFVAGTYRFKKY